ncbi:hypothetical protein FHG66_19265 [Rubellimicrobium rubrum]|uniref:Uncharacterized protein n=1 Tax=Rubellimicrobium rubrum TaxID=2585369 RepID=A0A5C4MPD7_9RHOB|nr:hypothetical protein [Rubellimicrobium rubrum]TNC46225.1 hypothetical protein FHG66_19265 [Rubellimicrobium rubrum]
MTVRADGAILLEGECPVEDSEALVQALQDSPGRVIDWTGATRLHTSVVQVVLLAERQVIGPCGDPFVARWIEPSMVAASVVEG